MSTATRTVDKTLVLPIDETLVLPIADPEGSDPLTTPNSAAAAVDLLAGVRWGSMVWLAAAAILAGLDIVAGWFYVASYFGYFHLPLEGLGVSAQEIVALGARSVLLPLAVVPVAFVAAAPSRRLRPAALAVAAYVIVLTYVAFATSFLTRADLIVQVAAMLTAAGILFALRRGFGELPAQRLILVAVALLAFSSLPVASGIFDASQKASATQTTLRLVTQNPILPGSVVIGGAYSYSDYVLLRESDSRYWVMRLGDHHVYSIAKSEVLYIRYW
ncbi:MAG: hypothetical protein ACYDAL_13830 [Candidatus Dormibacteraceae bacterium]